MMDVTWSVPRWLACGDPEPAKPFGKAIAETLRGIKSDFSGDAPKTDHTKTDPEVREEVNADLDRLIEKHEKKSK